MISSSKMKRIEILREKNNLCMLVSPRFTVVRVLPEACTTLWSAEENARLPDYTLLRNQLSSQISNLILNGFPVSSFPELEIKSNYVIYGSIQ